MTNFEAPWWLRNGHLQTLWSTLLRKREKLPWVQEILRTPDDDRICLYHLAGDEGAPHCLLLHGLEGTHRSDYIGGTGKALRAIGWNVSVLEFRGCSGLATSGKRLYHLGETTDLDFVVRTLIARGVKRLALSGVSLGGNVLVKWLGEQGEKVPAEILGGVAISPPFDLLVSGPHIDGQFGGLYSYWFLRRLIPKAVAKEKQFPGCVDIARVKESRSFLSFDTWATAALHGFRDAAHYWEDSSCGRYLDGVRVPLLLIAAEDDPFNPGFTIPKKVVESSPWLEGRFPETGGHVGFVYGLPWGTKHWAEEQVVGFLGKFEV